MAHFTMVTERVNGMSTRPMLVNLDNVTSIKPRPNGEGCWLYEIDQPGATEIAESFIEVCHAIPFSVVKREPSDGRFYMSDLTDADVFAIEAALDVACSDQQDPPMPGLMEALEKMQKAAALRRAINA